MLNPAIPFKTFKGGLWQRLKQNTVEKGSFEIKVALAEMLKGGVIMDVTTPEQAKIAEDAGAVAVMALETDSLRYSRARGHCPHVQPRTDSEDSRYRDHSCHG